MSDARQSLEVTIEGLKREVVEIGRADGDWEPTLLIETRNGERVVAPLGQFFVDDRTNREVWVAISSLIRQTDARLTAFVSSCWISERQDVAPRDDPGRIEVAFIAVESEAGESQTHMAEIVRRPGRPPLLKGWRSTTDPGGGPMADAMRAGFDTEQGPQAA